jgi:hypothetical protein
MPIAQNRRCNPTIMVVAVVLLVLCFVALALWAKRSDWQVKRLPLHGQERTLERRPGGAARTLSRI